MRQRGVCPVRRSVEYSAPFIPFSGIGQLMRRSYLAAPTKKTLNSTQLHSRTYYGGFVWEGHCDDNVTADLLLRCLPGSARSHNEVPCSATFDSSRITGESTRITGYSTEN